MPRAVTRPVMPTHGVRTVTGLAAAAAAALRPQARRRHGSPAADHRRTSVLLRFDTLTRSLTQLLRFDSLTPTIDVNGTRIDLP